MEAAQTSELKKKIIRKTGFVFLAVILIFTFFSKTIDNLLLPEVVSTWPVKGRLEKDVETEGEVKILDINEVHAYGMWKVKKVLAGQNDVVAKGQTLAVLDTGELALDRKRGELELLRLESDIQRYMERFSEVDLTVYEEDVKAAAEEVERLEDGVDEALELYEEGTGSAKDVKEAKSRIESAVKLHASKLRQLEQKKAEGAKNRIDYERTLKEKNLELDIKRLEFESMKKRIPAGGKIISPVSGMVKSVRIEDGSACSPGQLLFEIGENSGSIKVYWSLDLQKAKLMRMGDKVDVEANTPERMFFSGEITSRENLAAEGMVKFTAVLDLNNQEGKDIHDGNSGEKKEGGEENTEEETTLQDGQQVRVSAVRKSAEFPMLVPNCSIISEQGQSYVFILREREGALGIEHYVEKISVRVQDSDDFSSAIEGAGVSDRDNIVATFSKPLADGMQVKLK